MFEFLKKLIRKETPERRLKQHIENLIKRFKENVGYRDYSNILLFYQYFYEIIFKNLILSYLERYKQDGPIILEIGSYMSRTKHLLPPELQERFIISDINLEILQKNPQGVKLNFDFRNIPIKDNSVPIVIGSNVFLHILGLGDIEEILRILKEDGQAIFIEDLAMYMPALALYYLRKGHKYTYFVYDPQDNKLKCFLLDKKRAKEFSKEIGTLLKKSIDLKRTKTIIRNHFSTTAFQIFENLENAIKKGLYLKDPFSFCHSLFALTYQINEEYLFKDENERRRLFQFKLGFNNFLIRLRNIFLKYQIKTIVTWEDFLKDVQVDFKERGINLDYELVSMETNSEEIKKWQRKVLERVDLELLNRNDPNWPHFRDLRKLIIERLGWEIGCNGESVSGFPNNIKYTAAIIKIRKEEK
jgi:hypothetical protein